MRLLSVILILASVASAAWAEPKGRTNPFGELPKYDLPPAPSQAPAQGAVPVMPVAPPPPPADVGKWDTVELLGVAGSRAMVKFQRGMQHTTTVVEVGKSFPMFGATWRLKARDAGGFDVIHNGEAVAVLDTASRPVEIFISGRAIGSPGAPGAPGVQGAPAPYGQPYQPGGR